MATASLDIPIEVDPELYNQAEQGDIQARSELCSLAKKGWVSGLGWRPIQFAAANGHVNLVEMLAQEREQDLYEQQEDGWTLLHWVAFKGHVEVAGLLVHKLKAQVDEKDSIGR